MFDKVAADLFVWMRENNRGNRSMMIIDRPCLFCGKVGAVRGNLFSLTDTAMFRYECELCLSSWYMTRSKERKFRLLDANGGVP